MIVWFETIDWKKIIVFDWEKPFFLGTIDGNIEHTLKYSKEDIINCKHIDDFPGYTPFMEWAHLNPKAEDDRGRDAQQFHDESLWIYHKGLLIRGAIQIGLPKKRTPRIIDWAGYENDKTKSYLAWFAKIQQDNQKILSWFKPWHPRTEKEKFKLKRREENRRDSCYLIDRAASNGYDHPDVEDMRAIFLQAYNNNNLSKEAKEDRKIKFVKGKTGLRFEFNLSSSMALYWSICEEGGKLRTDSRGQPIGINTVINGLLQHHAYNAGKGSGASCRSKLRYNLLLSEENKDREKNGIKIKKKQLAQTDNSDEVEVGGFNDPRPEVRKRHEKINREILRLIRNSKNPDAKSNAEQQAAYRQKAKEIRDSKLKT